MKRPKGGCTAESLLRANHLRVTEPRHAILRHFMEHHGPFTMEEIRAGIGGRGGCRCDLVTVYRGVAAIEKAGLIVRCDFGDGTRRFERAHGEDGGHHHHVICRRCRKIEVVNACLGDQWKSDLRGMGYADLSHRLEFFGICRGCLASVSLRKE